MEEPLLTNTRKSGILRQIPKKSNRDRFFMSFPVKESPSDAKRGLQTSTKTCELMSRSCAGLVKRAFGTCVL